MLEGRYKIKNLNVRKKIVKCVQNKNVSKNQSQLNVFKVVNKK